MRTVVTNCYFVKFVSMRIFQICLTVMFVFIVGCIDGENVYGTVKEDSDTTSVEIGTDSSKTSDSDATLDSDKVEDSDVLVDSETDNSLVNDSSLDSDSSVTDSDIDTEPVSLLLYDEESIGNLQSWIIDGGKNIIRASFADSYSGEYSMQLEIQDGADDNNTGVVGYYFYDDQSGVDMTRSTVLSMQVRRLIETCDLEVALVQDTNNISSFEPISGITLTEWKKFDIELSKFTGVNKKLIRGLAFKGNNTAFCRVYLDYIEIN